MNLKSSILTGLLVVATATAWAQQPQSPAGERGGPGGAPGQQRRGAPDVMAENLFPPELVMQNQKALALTDEQTKAIREEMQKTMAKFTDLQWQQSAESETLTGLLKQDKPDEKQVLAQFDKLLGIENEIKKLHFGMMIRIKSVLTAEQQAQLREMKKQARPLMPPRGGRDDAGPGGSRGSQGRGPGGPPPEE